MRECLILLVIQVICLKLTDLYLNQNGFKQDLPTALKGIGNLEKLEYIILHDNYFSGQFPIDIFDLPVIKQIDIKNNQLTGPVLLNQGLVPKLEYFDVSNNELNGTIPIAIGRNTELSASFHGNEFIPFYDFQVCDNVKYLCVDELSVDALNCTKKGVNVKVCQNCHEGDCSLDKYQN